MNVLLGNWRGRQFQELIAQRPNIGNLLSPLGWANPIGCPYACDNDVYGHRADAAWWCREGEARWLKMLDKIPAAMPPIFVLLPDVVGDWPETKRRAWKYLPELRARNLPVGVALQNGAETDFESVLRLRPAYVFVGGSTAWKWRQAETICQYFHAAGVKVHVGRASGPRRIRECLRIGADSCDGTGWIRHSDAMLPGLWRELDGTHQQMRFEI